MNVKGGFDFAGYMVLMLGGINDISTDVARVFEKAGARLIIGYQNSQEAESLSTDLPAATLIETDLNKPQRLAKILADTSFNIVIISPGFFSHKPFMQTAPAEIDTAFSANFEQSTYAAQAAAKSLIGRSTPGSIIFLSSVASLTPMVRTNLTGSSLAAIEVIAKMAAIDLAPHDIRVNVVAAGWLESDWSKPLHTPDGKMLTASDIPVEEAGSRQSIGAACCFLASPMAAYITGTVLPVDGGFLLTKSSVKSPYPEK